jgi:tetratricopeptide (TPR) repeat protein
VLGALIFCATVLVYLPALSGNFIWNDSDYVTAPALRSLAGLARIWTVAGATQQYYPLLHSAFWVQHRLFGDHPLGYHIVTLLLHAGSAVLFALILRRLSAGDRARPCAGFEWLAALLFALHPVHVESVAWITEQKNTLSLACYLAAALTYLRFDQARRRWTYLAALAMFAASLACKTVTATLPAALLVIFWWQRGQLDWRRDVRPLLPWLALGVTAALFSSWVEHAYLGARGADFSLSAVGRVLVAGRAVWFYAGKLAWPFGLNFVYPRWTVDAAVWWQWLFPLGVLAVGAALWALRRRTRGPLAAFLFFGGSLFPVLGFVNLYGARYSWVWDHWQYLADLGLLALAAATLTAAWRRAALRFRGLGPGLVAALAVLLGVLTWTHCGMFHDDETLYRTTLARNPGCWLAHNNLGFAWSQRPGRLKDAIAEYETALRLQPDSAEAHYNLGVAWTEIPGRMDDAAAEFEAAVRLQPAFAAAHSNLGLAWSLMPGRLNDAVAQYEAALRLQPDLVETHKHLGDALSRIPGRLPDAIAQLEKALRLKPDSAETHNSLGVAWAKMPGRLPDAIAQLEEALRLKPDYAEAHYNLGRAWSETPGRLKDAIAQYEVALRLKPNFAPGWHNLGVSWLTLGNRSAAAAAFREELRLSPNDSAAQQALAAALQQGQDR